MDFGAREVILFIFGQLIVAAAIWGSIRADIKGMHYRISLLEQRFNNGGPWEGDDRRRNGNNHGRR